MKNIITGFRDNNYNNPSKSFKAELQPELEKQKNVLSNETKGEMLKNAAITTLIAAINNKQDIGFLNDKILDYFRKRLENPQSFTVDHSSNIMKILNYDTQNKNNSKSNFESTKRDTYTTSRANDSLKAQGYQNNPILTNKFIKQNTSKLDLDVLKKQKNVLSDENKIEIYKNNAITYLANILQNGEDIGFLDNRSLDYLCSRLLHEDDNFYQKISYILRSAITQKDKLSNNNILVLTKCLGNKNERKNNTISKIIKDVLQYTKINSETSNKISDILLKQLTLSSKQTKQNIIFSLGNIARNGCNFFKYNNIISILESQLQEQPESVSYTLCHILKQGQHTLSQEGFDGLIALFSNSKDNKIKENVANGIAIGIRNHELKLDKLDICIKSNALETKIIIDSLKNLKALPLNVLKVLSTKSVEDVLSIFNNHELLPLEAFTVLGKILIDNPSIEIRTKSLNILSKYKLPLQIQNIVNIENKSTDLEFIRAQAQGGDLITQSCFDTITQRLPSSLDIVEKMLEDNKQILPTSLVSTLAQNITNETTKTLGKIIKQGKSELPNDLLKTLIGKVKINEIAIDLINTLLERNKNYIHNISKADTDVISAGLISNNRNVRGSALNVIKMLSDWHKPISVGICNLLSKSDLSPGKEQDGARSIIEKHNATINKNALSLNKYQGHNGSILSNNQDQIIHNLPQYIDQFENSTNLHDREDAANKIKEFVSINKLLPDYAIDAIDNVIMTNSGSITEESLDVLFKLAQNGNLTKKAFNYLLDYTTHSNKEISSKAINIINNIPLNKTLTNIPLEQYQELNSYHDEIGIKQALDSFNDAGFVIGKNGVDALEKLSDNRENLKYIQKKLSDNFIPISDKTKSLYKKLELHSTSDIIEEKTNIDKYANWVIDEVSDKLQNVSDSVIMAISSVLINWDQETVESFLLRYNENKVNDLLLVQELYGVNNDLILLALDNLDGDNTVQNLINSVDAIIISHEFNLSQDVANKLVKLGYLPRDIGVIYESTDELFDRVVNIISSYGISLESTNYKDQNIIDIIKSHPTNFLLEVSKLGSEIGFSGGIEKDLDTLLREIEVNNKDIDVKDLRSKYENVMIHYNKEIKNWTEANIKDNARSCADLMKLIAIVKRANELSEKQNPRIIQILSLIVMTDDQHNKKGVLSQISTGEGKTTVVAMLAVLNAITKKKKVDIITSSPILASDGAKKKRNFYNLFGLAVGDNGSPEVGCYQKDIVYGSISNFQFDFLRDQYMLKGTRQNREFGIVIADEVDSMLIDEGSKIAMLSENIAGMEYLESFLSAIFITINNFLQGFTGETDEETGNLIFRDITDDNDSTALVIEDHVNFIKDQVIKAVNNEFFSQESKMKLPANFKVFAKEQVNNWVDMSILATRLKEKVDYIIKDNEVKPIDAENTGIVQTNTQWQNGLHQFLQMKHGLRITPESFTTCFISNVGYFKKYQNVYGLTGTLGSEESKKLLEDVYKVNCEFIPTYKQKQFIELPAVVTENQDQWLNNVVNSVKTEVDKGRGVLVICKSIQDVEQIKSSLQAKGINKTKCYSDDTIDKGIDGEKLGSGEVIVATNLAGRGTDIDASDIEKYGGLHVCLTFLPNNQRVEAQAFGRTSRQGQKGTGQLIIKGDYVSNDIDRIRSNRDAREKERLENIKDHELQEIIVKDKLFLSKFMPYIAGLKRQSVNKSVIKSIEERWGLFFAGLKFGEEFSKDNIFTQYEDFIQGVKNDLSNDNVIKSHCYRTLMGNELLDKEKYGEAITQFDKAITLDLAFAYTAHYNKAYAIIKNEGSEQDAKKELEQSLKIIDETLIPQLQAMAAVAGVCANAYASQNNQVNLESTDTKPISELDLQINSKMSLLGLHKRNIQKAIETITKKSEDNSIVIDSTCSLEDMYETDPPMQEIAELRGNGFRNLFTVKEKPPVNWWGIIGVMVLGALQVAAGAALTLCGAANIGAALIGEGVGDLITGVQSAISGEFNWGDYLQNKAVSLAISVVTMGASAIKTAVKAAGSVKEALKHGIKQIKQLPQKLVNKVAGKGVQKASATAASKELAKDGWKAVGKKVLAEVAEQAATELINYGVNLLTGEMLKQFESKIKNEVKSKLNSEVNKDRLSKVLVDETNSEQLYKAVNDFFNQKSSELITIGQQFIDGFANAAKKHQNNKMLQNIDWVMKIPQVSVGIAEASSYASKFCQEINQSMVALDNNEKTTNTRINTDSIIDNWAKNITDKIICIIQGQVINPLSNKVVSKSVNKFSNSIQKSMSSQGHSFDDKLGLWQQKRQLYKGVQKVANSNHDGMTVNNQNIKNIPNKTDIQNTHGKRTSLSLKPDRQGGMVDIAALSRSLDRPIEIYKDGKLYHKVGGNNAGEVLRLDYTPPIDGKPGHWEPHGFKANSSGKNNCLFDAVAHQTGENPSKLRQVADDARLSSNKYINKAQEAEQHLLKNQNIEKGKAEAMMGGTDLSIFENNLSNQYASHVQAIRNAPDSETRNAARIALANRLILDNNPKARMYNDNIRPMSYSVEFSQDGVNAMHNQGNPNFQFPNTPVHEVAQMQPFPAHAYNLGFYRDQRSPGIFFAESNRGLTSHAIANQSITSFRYISNPSQELINRINRRNGNGRSIRFDRNPERVPFDVVNLGNNPAGRIQRLHN
jgi:preprotein translocase subunit SecA